MEMENNYANKGVAGAGLGLDIAGTALGLLNGNGLGNILGGFGCNGNGGYYSRYDAEKDARIANLETEIKLRDANFFSLSETGKLRDYMEHRFDKVEHELADQRVYNAVNTATIGCVKNDVAELMALTKRVVPNGSICPGWGDVTVSVTPAPTTAG